MEDHSDFLPFEDSNNDDLISKYEHMRSIGAQFYFDVEEFEELVDYYLFHPEKHIVKEIIAIAKSQHPDSISLTLKEAEMLVYSEKTKEALKIADSIVLYEDSNPAHFFSKATIYSMADEKEKAIEILTRLIEVSDQEDLEEAQMALAKEFQELGDYPRAINIYREILRYSPENEDAILEMSLCCELGQDIHTGINLLNDFINEQPYSAFAWFSIGNLHLNVEDNEKAIAAFEYASLINEDFSEAFFNLGNTYMKTEKYQEAIDAFKSSISIEATDPISHNFIGHCYILLEDQHNAITHFNHATEISPEYGDGWLGLALAYTNLEKYNDSLLYIEKAIKLNPKNMYYQYFCADTLFNLDKFEEAEKVYEKVYSSELEATGIFLDYTETLLLNGNYDVAQNVLIEGITKFPEESLLYYRYSALMLELGHVNDAESILFLALEIDPKESSQFLKYYPDAVKHDSIMDLIENYK